MLPIVGGKKRGKKRGRGVDGRRGGRWSFYTQRVRVAPVALSLLEVELISTLAIFPFSFFHRGTIGDTLNSNRTSYPEERNGRKEREEEKETLSTAKEKKERFFFFFSFSLLANNGWQSVYFSSVPSLSLSLLFSTKRETRARL